MTDCIYAQNALSGFLDSHTGRCALGPTHPPATHHARNGGWCGNVCGPCADKEAKQKGSIVREIQSKPTTRHYRIVAQTIEI